MTRAEDTVLGRGRRNEERSRTRRWPATLARAAAAPFAGTEHWGPLVWWARVLCLLPAVLALAFAVGARAPSAPVTATVPVALAGVAWGLSGWRPRYAWWLALALNSAPAIAALTALPLPDVTIFSVSALVGSTAIVLGRAPVLPRRLAAGYALVLVLLGPHGVATPLWPLLLVLLTVIIDTTRTRRQAQASAVAAQANADEARAEARSAQERELLAQERARIARDLHDVVAHHMSLIVVRADTASYRLTGLDDPARSEFTELAEEARSALQEVRGVLTVLHDGGAPLTPQPGLRQVPALIEAARSAGAVVQAELPDPLPQVPAQCGIAAHRVVQESLSNARRHAPGQDVWVRVSVVEGESAAPVEGEPGAAEQLVVQVRNAATAAPGASGHGLRGLAEQARAAGGTLTVTSDGTVFAVEAHIPMARQQ